MAKRAAPAVIIAEDSDVIRGVRSLRRKCAIMRRVHDACGTPPLRRREPGLEGLLRIIVAQQLSVSSAAAIWSRVETTFQPMSAATILAADDDTFRSAGLSRPKIKTLRAIATAVDSGLDLERLGDQSDEDVHAALTAISGVGPWTADIFLMFCLGRADSFAPGDLALQIAAQMAFELDQRPKPDQLEELAEAWRPWRSVAARLLWAYYKVRKDAASGVPV